MARSQSHADYSASLSIRKALLTSTGEFSRMQLQQENIWGLAMRRTDTQTLAKAMEILAREIQSVDGVANAAIAEAAERLYSLDIDLHKKALQLAELERQLAVNHERAEGTIRAREAKLERVCMALRDCLSTFREDDKATLISAERQEAWLDALNS